MTAVFKFAKRGYVDDAVQYGRIRLNHVATFRASDGVGDGRSDSKELIESATVLDGEEVVSSDDPRFAGMFARRKGGVNVPTEIVVSADTVVFYDSGLLLCTSLDNSDDVFKEMKTKFGNDAAYEITDVEEFARRIELHLIYTEPHLVNIKARIARLIESPHENPEFKAAKLRFLRWELDQSRPLTVDCGPVNYYDQSRAESIAAIPPVDAFRKPVVYEWQREHRIVIRPYDAENFLDV